MDYISYMNRKVLICILVFMWCKSYGQEGFFYDEYIYGKWECVKSDYRGYQKYNFEQAEKIRQSVLNIERHRLYYSGIEFIEPCNYSHFNISNFDTSLFYGYSIEFVYSKKELAKIFVYVPVDEKGNDACFNDCVTLLLKQDTLINICGGYTFYLLKINKE